MQTLTITFIGCLCCSLIIGVAMLIFADDFLSKMIGIIFITIAFGGAVSMAINPGEFISQPIQTPSSPESTTFNFPAPIEKTPYYENAPFKPAPTVAPNNQWGNINNVAQQPIDNNMFSGFDNPTLQ